MVGYMFERFTSEARESLERASSLAAARGDGSIGPEHLLAGLADPRSGLAATLLAEAGIGAEVVAAAMPPARGGASSATPPFTGASKKALELSLREALNLAHGHIGSGHLLLGLLRLDEGVTAATFAAHGVSLEGIRAEVRERSEGAKLGGRRRPRRTGRIVEAPTAHEQAQAAATRAAPRLDDDDVVRLAGEDGSRLQRALASLGVTAEELRSALADVAAEPDDGPVELDLGGGASLIVASGARAADLRALLGAAEHLDAQDEPDGILRIEVPALGDAVWATLEGWLTASAIGPSDR